MLSIVSVPRSWFKGLAVAGSAIVLAFLLAPPAAQATLFNWPDLGWTAGAPAPGQTFSQSFTSVTPNDITLSINNNGASGSGAAWQSGYPAINSTKETGGLSGVDGVQLWVTGQSSVSSYIKTTVAFNTPVINLSFQIWDVDLSSGQFTDKIAQIQALAQGGGTVGPDSVTSALPGYNSITGSGLSTVVLGTATASDTTNQGTITITFLGPITQFSFQWSNSDSALGTQAIALGPLTYTIVPEPSTGWSVALLCAAAIAGPAIVRRRKTVSRP
jgi:hypothetical protein